MTDLEYALDALHRTVELERGRFATYHGGGRWETYFLSRDGARAPDGLLMNSDVLARFPPGSFERSRVEQIIQRVDGAAGSLH